MAVALACMLLLTPNSGHAETTNDSNSATSNANDNSNKSYRNNRNNRKNQKSRTNRRNRKNSNRKSLEGMRSLIQFAGLHRLEVDFELLGMFVTRGIRRLGGDDWRETKYQSIQRLGARAAGFFLHPDLWSWKARAVVHVAEAHDQGDIYWVDGDENVYALGGPQTQVAVEPLFAFESEFLRTKPFRLQGFVARDAYFYESRFRPQSAVTELSSGGSATLLLDTWMATARYQYVERESERQMPLLTMTSHFATVNAASLAKTGGRLRAQYYYSTFDDPYFPVLGVTLHRADLRSTWTQNLEVPYLISIQTVVSSYERAAATFRQTRTGISAGTQITRDLRLGAGFAAGLSEAGGAVRSGLDASVWVRHQLYRSLVSTGALTVRRWDTSQSEVEELTGQLGLAYRKKVWLGEMRHGLDLLLATRTTTVTSAREQSVFDRRIVLRGTAPASLSGPGLVNASLIVANADGTQVYTRGIDFELLRIGDTIFISRSPTSAIPDGAEVIASFRTADAFVPDQNRSSVGYSFAYDVPLWGDVGRWLVTYSWQGGALSQHDASTRLDARMEHLSGTLGYYYARRGDWDQHSVGGQVTLDDDFARRLYVAVTVGEHVSWTRGDPVNQLSLGHSGRLDIWRQLSAEWRVRYGWQARPGDDLHTTEGQVGLHWPLPRQRLRAGVDYSYQILDHGNDYGTDEHLVMLRVAKDL